MSLFASERSHVDEALEVATAPTTPGWWPWVWMISACAVLGASGLVRLWQDARFAAVRDVKVAPVFNLTELPREIGTWTDRGGDSALDPKVARIAGSTDSLIRTYVDGSTGVCLDVLVIYGSAELISSHRPEVCYPAVGYTLAETPIDQTVTSVDSKEFSLRSMWYARWGKTQERQEVFYTFRQNDRWSPHVDGNWKTLSRSPDLFKVQVQRRIADQERRYVSAPNSQGASVVSPTVRFLAMFLPEIERQIKRAAGRGSRGAPSAP
jgi:Protein of unknown function (DUF3485)